MAKTSTDHSDQEPSLHRVMGPWLLLLFIVGDILGTGIYALTGPGRKAGRRRRLAAVSGGLRRRGDHCLQLP